MGRFVQPTGNRGSLRWIQQAVNTRQLVLDRHILEASPIRGPIHWLSPKSDDDFAEYRDGDFLQRIGLEHIISALTDFWPNRGPQWDALGRSENGDVLLVEAKAHVGEICSPASQAGVDSAAKIDIALVETAAFIGAEPKAPWRQAFYQLANRIAHLHFLRRHGVDAWLVLVNFTGDVEMRGPASEREWKAAYQVVEHLMGLKGRHALSRYIVHVYPDVAELI